MLVTQGADQPVGGTEVEPGQLGDLSDAQVSGAVVEQLQHAQSALDALHSSAWLAALVALDLATGCHVGSLPYRGARSIGVRGRNTLGDGIMASAAASAAQISQLPHLRGLDGLRALAVVAVMVYHANHSWLSGGFLGVEMFFVISGYLITLLLIGEHERSGRVRLGQFWLRRARRLLPALFVMMTLLAMYLALFNRRPQGRTRGDFIGGILYGSNWYQIVVGQGYTATEAFAPLRHLWSLAVEEQFYLVWPLVMLLILRHGARPVAAGRRAGCSRSARQSLPRPLRCSSVVTSRSSASRAVRQATSRFSGAVSASMRRCISAHSAGAAVCCSAPRSRCGGVRWRSCAARCARRAPPSIWLRSSASSSSAR